MFGQCDRGFPNEFDRLAPGNVELWGLRRSKLTCVKIDECPTLEAPCRGNEALVEFATEEEEEEEQGERQGVDPSLSAVP